MKDKLEANKYRIGYAKALPLGLWRAFSIYHRLCALLLVMLTFVAEVPLYGDAVQSGSHSETTKSLPQVTPPGPNEPVFPLTIEDPFKNNEKFVTDLLNMLATLGLILAIILVIAWFFKRMVNVRIDQANAGSSIRVLETRSLSQKTLLYILEVEDKIILMAESNNGVTHLANFSVPTDQNDALQPSSNQNFRTILEKKDKP